MKRVYISLLILLFTCFAHGKKLAITIGNDNYIKVPKLQKARNDADLMGANLQKVGYNVTILKDTSYKDMVFQIDKFISQIGSDDEVVFFYAGHGVQLKTGNYFLPIDLDVQSESVVEKTSYSLDELMEKLNETKARFKLIIIDACRDNPLAVKGRSVGGSRGLAPPEPPKGQMVIYSASRGQQALDALSDNDKNPNGVFTRIFANKLVTSQSSVETIAKSTQEEVEMLAKSINHEQRPAIYNESRGDFYFNNITNARISNSIITTADPDTKFWQEASKIDKPSAYKAYLDKFPNGIYRQLALIQIQNQTIERKESTNTAPKLESATIQTEVKIRDINSLSIYLNEAKLSKPTKKMIQDALGSPKIISQNQDGNDVLIWDLNYKNNGALAKASVAITFSDNGRASTINYRIVNN